MTVSSSTSKASTDGDGTTTSFTVPFYFLVNSHVLVTFVDTDGTETEWVENTHYTLTGAGNPAGGTNDAE